MSLWVSGVTLSLVRLVQGSCDLTGDAWPVVGWRDIMRETSVATCELTTRGDGRCDNTNNMATDSCGYDGGDCCLSSCLANCVMKQQILPTILGGDLAYTNPLLKRNECAAMCGVVPSPDTNCPYLCLDDEYMSMGDGFTGWCDHDRGTKTAMSDCYSTFEDIVTVLQECVMDSRSHGNGATASLRCGNQTMDCTAADSLAKTDGCHYHPNLCTKGNCCDVARNAGWITYTAKTIPSACDLYTKCLADEDCFPTLAECVRTNKACKGGCCKCNPTEWFGPNCDQPLCWPKCRRGTCVAPNTCYCNAGWSGPSCEIPVCNPNCVGGQGVCVHPNKCECFYGFEGLYCQLPKSTPPCLNGVAVGPDICKCSAGWGGRICDYPICQAYPVPSSDCGHGVCESPWSCKCEPGWSLTIPVGADGLDTVPTFWKGRETSTIIEESDFVFGDSRFDQTAPNKHIFLQYNAYKCNTADCRLIADAHCASCEEATGTCLTCDIGFYLDTGRCSKCQLIHRHCRACSEATCTACDPLFALVGGNCVSDGIVEFSSNKYHVGSGSEFVEVKVLRTIDSLDFAWLQRDQLQRNSLEFLLHSVPGQGDPGTFADFETTRTIVQFDPIDSAETEPTEKADARELVTLVQTIPIRIFDNLRFDPSNRSFKLRLLPDPEAVCGSTFPIRPEPGQSTFAGRAEDEAIVETEIFIWDDSTFDFTTCEISSDFLETTGRIPIGTSTFDVPVRCQKCTDANAESGCVIWSYWETTDDFRIASTVEVVESAAVPSLVTSSLGAAIDDDGYIQVPVSLPVEADISFDFSVKVVYSGVLSTFFTWTPVPTPGQAPDVIRREHILNREWDHAQAAPAYAEYSGYIHFGCISDPDDLPSFVGIAVSQGGQVILDFAGVTEIDEIRSVATDATDLEWQAPTTGICDDDGTEGIFCFATSPEITDVIPFSLVFKPSPLDYQRPAGIRLIMLQGTVWTVVPEACLYAAVDILQSPIRGLATTD